MYYLRMSGCVSEHVIPNTFKFVSPQNKLSYHGPYVISSTYLESSCTTGCFKSITMEIRQPKKELDVKFLSLPKCHSEHMSFRTHVIPNICHSKHMSFQILPKYVPFHKLAFLHIRRASNGCRRHPNLRVFTINVMKISILQ